MNLDESTLGYVFLQEFQASRFRSFKSLSGYYTGNCLMRLIVGLSWLLSTYRHQQQH